MRRFMLLIPTAAMLAAIVPAGARAQAQATTVPPPQPILIKLDGVPTVQLSDGGGGLPYLGATAPYNAGPLVPALTAFHDSGTNDREIAQIDALADAWVRGRGARLARASRAARALARSARATTRTRSTRTATRTDRRRSPGHRDDRGRGNGRPAIVLDIDETSLSNYSAIVADGFTFGPNSQAEATNEVGKAIAQTLKVFNDAKARGIAVFFVTGRPESQRAVTEDNLRREGFVGWQGLTLKPVGSTLTTVAYKSGARAAIEQQGFRIVANVGDQDSDLAGGRADRAFKIPTPFYSPPGRPAGAGRAGGPRGAPRRGGEQPRRAAAAPADGRPLRDRRRRIPPRRGGAPPGDVLVAPAPPRPGGGRRRRAAVARGRGAGRIRLRDPDGRRPRRGALDRGRRRGRARRLDAPPP